MKVISVAHNADILVDTYQFHESVKKQVVSKLKEGVPTIHRDLTNVKATVHTTYDWEPKNIVFRNLKAYIREEINRHYKPGFIGEATRETLEEAKYTHLDAGETAPFAGILFNPSALADLLSEKTYSDEECDLEIEYQVSRARSEMQLQLDSLQISYDALEEKHQLLMDIKNSEIDTYREMALDQPNKNNQWWLVGGVVVGIGLSLGTFYAVTEINE